VRVCVGSKCAASCGPVFDRGCRVCGTTRQANSTRSIPAGNDHLKPSCPALVPARPKVCTRHVRELVRFQKKCNGFGWNLGVSRGVQRLCMAAIYGSGPIYGLGPEPYTRGKIRFMFVGDVSKPLSVAGEGGSVTRSTQHNQDCERD